MLCGPDTTRILTAGPASLLSRVRGCLGRVEKEDQHGLVWIRRTTLRLIVRTRRPGHPWMDVGIWQLASEEGIARSGHVDRGTLGHVWVAPRHFRQLVRGGKFARRGLARHPDAAVVAGVHGEGDQPVV